MAALITGEVRLDTSGLAAQGLGSLSASGVFLIANNGGGLISDKGLGLLPAGEGPLIASNGSAIIANNGGGLVANNGGGLIGKTKSWRLFDLASDPAGASSGPAASGPANGLRPVAGLFVTATDLLAHRVIAGPVLTDAQGHYQLGFVSVPATNLRIVAQVHPAESQDELIFPTLSAAPTASAPDAPGTALRTTDTTDAVARLVLSVLPSRLQPLIDAHKAGHGAEVYLGKYSPNAPDILVLKAFDKGLASVPAATLTQLDPDGVLARGISERMVAYADLGKAPYLALAKDFEAVRAFGETITPPPSPTLIAQVLAVAQTTEGVKAIPALLGREGMASDQALALGQQIQADGDAIASDLGPIALLHQHEVLGPLADLMPPLSPF